jgi:hypothetical protein
MKKVHKCLKWGMERRVVKRCDLVRSPAKRETTPCLPSLSTESPGGCQSTMKLIEKATMLVHCKRAKDHGDAVAIAAAGDNGWMVLLTVRDRCYLGEESLVARVASHVAARRWRRNSQRRDFFDVLRLLCILTQACPSRHFSHRRNSISSFQSSLLEQCRSRLSVHPYRRTHLKISLSHQIKIQIKIHGPQYPKAVENQKPSLFCRGK